MKLAEAFGDLLGGARIVEILGIECTSVEEFFEATVREGAQKAGTNSLASQTSENLEFGFAIYEVVYVCTVDAEEQFTGRH